MKKEINDLLLKLQSRENNIVKNENKLSDLFTVISFLFSDEEIREAADEWVFDKNGIKWSNNDNTAGDNFASFMAGAKWVLERLSSDPNY
jgi:hypothetical protein